jgi:hypothetical protein
MNICLNRAVIRHMDPEQRQRLINVCERGTVCDEFLPVTATVEDQRDWRGCFAGTYFNSMKPAPTSLRSK